MKKIILFVLLAVAARAQTNTAWVTSWAVEANPVVLAPSILPASPSDFIITNSFSLLFDASPSGTNVTGYNVLVGTNSFLTNGPIPSSDPAALAALGVSVINVGNVTNPVVDFTNNLPVWISAESYDGFGDVSSLATNELYWDGLIPYDVTNYVYLTASGVVGGVQTTNIPVVTWTNQSGMISQQFFRSAGFTLCVTGQVSSDLIHWTPTNWPLAPPISNATFRINELTTELWTNAP